MHFIKIKPLAFFSSSFSGLVFRPRLASPVQTLSVFGRLHPTLSSSEEELLFRFYHYYRQRPYSSQKTESMKKSFLEAGTYELLAGCSSSEESMIM